MEYSDISGSLCNFGDQFSNTGFLKEGQLMVGDQEKFSASISEMDRNGFVVLKGVYSLDTLLEVKDDLYKFIASSELENSTRDIHRLEDQSISSVHNIIEFLPSYKEIINNEETKSFAKACFGQLKDQHFNSSYFRKPPNNSLATKAHQDNAFFCMSPAESFTYWIPLTDVASNSPIYYYSGSHVLSDVEHINEGNLGASQCLSPASLEMVQSKFEKIEIQLEVGDCVVHNSLVVHGADPNIGSVSREAFNFTISSKMAVRDELLYQRYQARLKNFLSQKSSEN